MTRQLCRLGGVYIVDRARFLARTVDQNFVTALVFTAISRANVGGIAGSRAASDKYLAMRDVPPDETRIPVTIYALARDLGIPYETVRRHVGKLKDWGACVTVEDGVIIPSRVFHSPEAHNGAVDTEAVVRILVNEAARSGVMGKRPQPAVANDVTLQVARLASHYFVEGVSLLAKGLDLDVLSALVFLTIGQMNTAGITRDRDLSSLYAGLDDIPPDDLRTPVKAYTLSRYLMLPYETARRTGLRLVEMGLATRNEAGALTLPAELFAQPRMMALFAEFAGLTVNFLDGLAEYGVTAQAPVAPRPAVVPAQAAWRQASAF